MPKISVCIPAHNSECWIAEAIESIIDQTFEDWEILVLDDHSTDTTEKVLRHYFGTLKGRFRWFTNDTRKGIAYCRNELNKKAAGEIICVQDSDDISHKERLKKTWKYFQRHKDVSLIYGSYQYIDVFGKPFEEEKSKPWNFEEWVKHNYIGHPTVAYRKKDILKVPYRESCKVLDDLFLYLDFHKAEKKIAQLEDTLAFYRIRPTSVSHTKEKEIEEMRKKFQDETNTRPLDR